MSHETQPPLILIVEDDSKTAGLIDSYLQKEHFATVKASDGRKVLETFAGNPLIVSCRLLELSRLERPIQSDEVFRTTTAVRRISGGTLVRRDRTRVVAFALCAKSKEISGAAVLEL